MKIDRQKGSSQRVVGDSIWYFCFHNLVSVSLFFIFTLSWGLYGEKNSNIGYIFSTDFWLLFLQIFAISLISGIIARISVFIIMRAYYRWQGKSMKRWGEISSGMNKIGLTFLLSTLLTALVFCLGLIAILQDRIFDEKTLLTLMFSYLIIKLGIFFIIRLLTEVKM